jgi:hypothetical protein
MPRRAVSALPLCAPVPPQTQLQDKASMSKWLLSLLVLFTIAACLAPAEPTPPGTWVLGADDQTASVSGRVELPIWKKLNPVWWFLNDYEPDPPDWQLPGKPFLIRQLSWYARNPLQNFGRYVIGVHDRNYTVVGTAPVYATNWSDVGPDRTGWKFSRIHIGPLRLPYVSYESEHVLWYAGWQWSGFFGFKLNVKKAAFQIW